MKKKFKKIMSAVGSVLMVGSTVGFAMAAGGAFPSPFVQNSNADYAIVYGVGAAASDVTAANSINTYLNTFYTVDTSTDTGTSTIVTSDFSSSVSLSDEVELGLDNIIVGSKLREVLEDNKLSTLLDTTVRWDNGDGSESYDIHEEILLTNEGGNSSLKLVTNLYHPNGEDLDSYVVLQNDKSLRYRLVFDDELEYPDKWEDADALRVSILGKEYEIIEFDPEFEDITISLSEEKVVKEGTILNIDGVTLTIGTIFDDEIQVNGIIINEDSTKKVDGIEVQVKNVALHTDNTLSKAVIRVGKDIERDISNGDEYIKGDETWEWDMGIHEGKQYIGVKYALKNIAYDEDEPEENPIIPGQSYIFPENYAALSFDGLTNVTYNDFELSFDDKDLYIGEKKMGDNIDVAIFQGEEDDSITLMYDGNEVETDSLYFNYSVEGVGVSFKDIDGDVDSDKKGRIQFNEMYEFSTGDMTEILPVDFEDVTVLREPSTFEVTGHTFADIFNLTEVDFMYDFEEGEGLEHIMYLYIDNSGVLTLLTDSDVDANSGIIEEVLTEVLGEITGYEYDSHVVTKEGDVYTYQVTTPGVLENKSYTNIAKLIVKDTEIDLGLDLNTDKTVYLTLTNGEEVTKMQLGWDNNEFKHLGEEADNADARDIIVGNKSIGTMDYDVMDNYGTIIKNPENYADDDRVILSVPDEQVYATVSVKGKGEEVVTTEDVNTTTTVTPAPILGGIIVKDTEIASVNTKNLIIVGGSCINAEAAKLLGGKACGEDFTVKTGVIAGQALIQTFASPYNATKVAVVVAGYNAVDTTKGVDSVINSGVNLIVGQRTIV